MVSTTVKRMTVAFKNAQTEDGNVWGVIETGLEKGEYWI
jgi:hypothetical protein